VTVTITRITPNDAHEVAVMTGELLEEIMAAIGARAFDFVLQDAEARLNDFIANGKYVVFVATDAMTGSGAGSGAGFIALYESYSIYAAGAFGTIPELYVRPAYRLRRVGKVLLDAARAYGAQRGWTRLEVTTPPIPAFQRTLAFYEREGFAISGGRKLQCGL
jgi:GNAT superfamily N-acetyltransferase